MKNILLLILCFTTTACLALFTACEKPSDGTDGAEQAAVEYVELDVKNAKTEYVDGETPTAAGVLVKVVRSDGSVGYVFPEDCEVGLSEANADGVIYVTLTYGGKSAAYPVTIRRVAGLYLELENVKTVYSLGESFDLSGLKVFARYFGEENREELSSDQYTVSYPDTSVYGTHTVTVTYGVLSERFNVKVVGVDVSSLRSFIEDGKLRLEVKGTVGGYEGVSASMDLENTGNWQRTYPDCSYSSSGSAFTLNADISNVALAAKPYFIHVVFDEKAYDIPVSALACEMKTEYNGENYTLKTQTVFENSDVLYIVLQAGDPTEQKGSAAANKIELSDSDGKATVTVSGTYEGGYKASDFALRSEQYGVFTKTPYTPTVVLKDGTFTVSADVTALSAESDGTHYFHISFDGGENWQDVADLENVVESSVTVGGKTYSLSHRNIWGNGVETCLISVSAN